MNTIIEPSVEKGASRPASAAFSLHRCNRLSNVLAALKLRHADDRLATPPTPIASEARDGRPAAPHYLSLR